MTAFSVDGLPVPQGSKTIAKAGKKVWLRDANATKLKPWRQKVAAAADLGVTFDGPLAVFAVFYLPKPQRPRWWAPAVKPDVDKLSRALLDGMTDGGLLADDARVTELFVMKRYESPSNPVGVRVLVMEDEEVSE
ncbi:MAG: RusA family crossover junction endodeoxyribonuclease [Leucobacter sp.]